MKKIFLLAILQFPLYFCFFASPLLYADDKTELSNGQTIYAPAYSHIYTGNRETPFPLTVTLSIRNIDQNYSLNIFTVDYYETQGKLLKKYVSQPITLKPLQSIRYIVPEKDNTGGSGAN